MKDFEFEIEKAFARARKNKAGRDFYAASYIKQKCRDYLVNGDDLKNLEVQEMLGRDCVDNCVKYLEIATQVLCGLVKELNQGMGVDLEEEVKQEIKEIKAAVK